MGEIQMMVTSLDFKWRWGLSKEWRIRDHWHENFGRDVE